MREGSPPMLGEWPELPPQVIEQLHLMYEQAQQAFVVVVKEWGVT